MKTALIFLGVFAICILFFWLRTFPFREKKTKETERTAKAEVISRRVQSGNPHRSGRSTQGYTFLVTFRLEDGTELELYTYDVEYGALREGMEGQLTWKGLYFIRFSTGREG